MNGGRRGRKSWVRASLPYRKMRARFKTSTGLRLCDITVSDIPFGALVSVDGKAVFTVRTHGAEREKARKHLF